MYEDMKEMWDNGPATPMIDKSCNASTRLTDNGDKVYFGEVNVRCSTFQKGGQCEVYDFYLPQDKINNGFKYWIKGRGHPEYMLFYQSLPKTVPESWKHLGDRFNTMGLMIGAGISIVTPAFFKLGGTLLRLFRVGPGDEAVEIGIRGMMRSVSDDIAETSTKEFLEAVMKWPARKFTVARQSIRKSLNDWYFALKGAGKIPTIGRSKALAAMDDIEQRILGQHVPDDLTKAQVRGMIDDTVLRNAPASSRDRLANLIYSRHEAALRFAREEAEGAPNAYRKTLLKRQYYRNYFRNYMAADDLAEFVMKMSASPKAIVQRVFSKAHVTLKNVKPQTREALVRQGRRVACNSMVARAGVLKGIMGALRQVNDKEMKTLKQLPKDFDDRLLTGAKRNLGGMAMCGAYSKIATKHVVNRLCSKVGVSTPDVTPGIGAGGTAVCMGMTAAGVSAVKTRMETAPHAIRKTNSLYLYKPISGALEFPLNNYTNFFFVGLDKKNFGMLHSSYDRFYLASPMNMRKVKNSPKAKIVVEHEYPRNMIQGKAIANKPSFDPCAAFKEFQRRVQDHAIPLLFGLKHKKGAPIHKGWRPSDLSKNLYGFSGDAVAGPIGPSYRFGNFLLNYDEMKANIEYQINESWAESHYMGTFFMPSSIMEQFAGCTANIAYTTQPIVGREVRYGVGESLVRQAPPGYKPGPPHSAEMTTGSNLITDINKVFGDEPPAWSVFMPTTQARDTGKGFNDLQQVGSWENAASELPDEEARPEEVEDIAIVFQWPEKIATPDPEIPDFCIDPGPIGYKDFSWNPGKKCVSPTDIGWTDPDTSESGDGPNPDIVIPDIPLGDLPNPPQLSVSGTKLVEKEGEVYVEDISFNDMDFSEVDILPDGADYTIDFQLKDFWNPPDWFPKEIKNFGIHHEGTIPFPDVGNVLGWTGGSVSIDPSDVDNEHNHMDITFVDLKIKKFQKCIDFDIDPPVIGEIGIEGCTPEIGPITFSPTWQDVPFETTTAYVPQKFLGPNGKGISHYTYPTMPRLIMDPLDTKPAMDYRVSALSVHTKNVKNWETKDKKPIFGWDAASDDKTLVEAGVYTLGAAVEMIVVGVGGTICTLPSATAIGVAVTVGCYGVLGGMLGVIGAGTEAVVQWYKSGCRWPVHACDTDYAFNPVPKNLR